MSMRVSLIIAMLVVSCVLIGAEDHEGTADRSIGQEPRTFIEMLRTLYPNAKLDDMLDNFYKAFRKMEDRTGQHLEKIYNLKDKSTEELRLILIDKKAPAAKHLAAAYEIHSRVRAEDKFNVDVVLGTETTNAILERARLFLRSREGRGFLTRNRRALVYPPSEEAIKKKLMETFRKEFAEWDKANGNILSKIGINDPKVIQNIKKAFVNEEMPKLNLNIYYSRDSIWNGTRNAADAVVNVLHSDIAVKMGRRPNGLVSRVMRNGSNGTAFFQGAYDRNINGILAQVQDLVTDSIESQFRKKLDDRATLNLVPQKHTMEPKSRVTFYLENPKTHAKETYFNRQLEKLDEDIPPIFGDFLQDNSGLKLDF